MHRLFKWQENIWIHLKKQTKDSVAVESLDCETLYIPKDVLETHIKNGRIINNLSRKDARFDSNREWSNMLLIEIVTKFDIFIRNKQGFYTLNPKYSIASNLDRLVWP